MEKYIYHQGSLEHLSFLITGGAGFIGSHLTGYLLRHGAKKVRVLDNFSTGHRHNLTGFTRYPAFELMEGDIRDAATCEQAAAQMDYLSHQAALGAVPRSVADPLSVHQVNTEGFLNVLLAARNQKVKRLVYASSSSVYGDSAELPKSETHTGNLLSPYAVTKMNNEQYAAVFQRIYGTDCAGLRYFNVFGPGQDPAGPYAAVIPLFIRALLLHKPAQINGDGEQTRDFTFIENVVQANVKAMLFSRPLPYPVYNVACAENISLNQLWEMLKELHGTDPGQIFSTPRAGDIRHSFADLNRIQSVLGYQPLYSLREGLSITLSQSQS